jgi:hypothetical protein
MTLAGCGHVSPTKGTGSVSIDLDKAREIALGYLKALESEVGQELSIARYEPVSADGGWLFFYNTSAYLGSGNISHALAGNGPLFVGCDGRLTVLSARGIERRDKADKE